jgi:hypothetical protein
MVRIARAGVHRPPYLRLDQLLRQPCSPIESPGPLQQAHVLSMGSLFDFHLFLSSIQQQTLAKIKTPSQLQAASRIYPV